MLFLMRALALVAVACLTMHPERRHWTPEELETLEKLLGRVSAATIARRLYRTETSVVMKIRSFGNSRRVTEGYTIRDLEECLGEDHHKIHKWISNGWLKERSQQTKLLSESGREIHHFQEKDVISFIKQHGTEINLGKVDQVWFLDMILLKGKMANGPLRSRKEETGKRVLTEHGSGSRLIAGSQNVGRNTY